MMDARRFRRMAPALTLAVLAPVFGELLSGSSPPLEFFSPVGLLFLVAFYGGGAIVVRELAVRWGGTSRSARWAIVLLLGAAYGIVEEGLAVKSFFDPRWMDLGVLGHYGRLAGVNWLWSIELTLFHMLVSIAAPIVITELLFRERRDEPWVGRRGLAAVAAVFMSVAALINVAMTSYRPPLIPYAAAAAVVGALAFLARRTGRASPGVASARVPTARVVLAISFGFAFVEWVVLLFVLPALNVPSLIPIGLALVVAAVAGRWLMRVVASSDRTDMHTLALVSGVLLVWVFVAVLDELSGLAGMSLVAAATVFGLVRIRRLIECRTVRILKGSGG
jgi:hypothetical protein